MKTFNAFKMPSPLWNATTEGAPSALTTGTTDTTETSTATTTEETTDAKGTDGQTTEVSKETEEGKETESGKTTEATTEPLTAESIKLPEGMTMAEETTTAFLDIMNNAEFTPSERAQALIDLQADATASASEAAEAANQTLWDETQTAWQTELSNLPEIGGKELPKTLATIKKGLEAVGADANTFAAFDLTGAGNHPAIIKVLHALTKTKVEGTPVIGTTSTAPADRATKMFGGKGK